MNKSQRIYFESGNTSTENHIKVQLEQDVDSIEFLSMSINTKDVYQDFNADYGVLVGRVIANGSIGIPNARVSIFIPLADDDAENSEISSYYPYKTPRDKNVDGKRYNLLPRVAKTDLNTGISTPKQPFGSFPIKEELVINESFLNVYKKYYKYTALTNNSGDYMIFGVPTGTQTVHLSVDITDIGKYSMSPAAMVTNLGYSANLFTDNNTKIKPSNDLNDLPHIETQEISVDVIPFWGDTQNFEIGITRQDFRIRSALKNTFTIFGSVFTDAYNTSWGDSLGNDNTETYLLWKMSDYDGGSSMQNLGLATKRPTQMVEKIYYYPENITDEEIEAGTAVNSMLLLDPSEYSIYKQNGDFVIIINCNRKRVVMDEQSNLISAGSSSQAGLYTEFKGFMTLEVNEDIYPLDWTAKGENVWLKPIRQKLKFPQHAACGQTFRNPVADIGDINNNAWRQQHYTFCGGGIYSIAKFNGLVYNCDQSGAHCSMDGGFVNGDYFNDSVRARPYQNAGMILTSNYGDDENSTYQMCPNSTMSYGGCQISTFGGNWLNMSVYLPQTAWAYNGYNYIYCWRANSQFTYARKNDTYYMNENQQQIAGSYYNTCSFARSDVNWTDFICVPKEDIVRMNNVNSKGFMSCDFISLSGTTYRNGTYVPDTTWCAASPLNGSRCNGCPTCAIDCQTYFYKGVGASDVISLITCLGIV